MADLRLGGHGGGETAARAAPVPHTSERAAARHWRAIATPYLFLAPCILLFLIFRVYPLLQGLYLSFTDARLGRTEFDLVGLANYQRLLEDTRFHVSMLNTTVYTLVSTVPILALPLLLAVALNRGASGTRALQRGVFFFPFTLSVVTVGLTCIWLLDPVVGPFSYYARQLGLPVGSTLGDPRTAMWGVVAASVWWVTGYYLVIYLAGLQDIPQHLYEAAAIDGASPWRSFWSITLPLLRPIFLYVVVIHIIGSFQIFGQVFVMTGGGPADATRTVVQHLYETGFKERFHFGSASAISWVLFLVILVFSVLQFRFLRGRAEY
ncbi:MAG: sugar ABC transporter permease [Chloroflexota bacterium]|nr:sugar ABC transporter permease [Chloroflexota bacterium]